MIVTETSRLILRHLAPADAAFYRRLVNEPSWLQNIGDRGIRTQEDAEEYIRTKSMETYRTLGFGMYLVESKADAQPIGVCGLVKRESLPDLDLGFALLPEFWGQGYAREAAAAVMDLARTSLGLSRLLAITSLGNHASGSLLEKLGFRFEGIVRLPPGEEELKLFSAEL